MKDSIRSFAASLLIGSGLAIFLSGAVLAQYPAPAFARECLRQRPDHLRRGIVQFGYPEPAQLGTEKRLHSCDAILRPALVSVARHPFQNLMNDRPDMPARVANPLVCDDSTGCRSTPQRSTPSDRPFQIGRLPINRQAPQLRNRNLCRSRLRLSLEGPAV